MQKYCVLLSLIAVLYGCGQKGSLSLPKEKTSTEEIPNATISVDGNERRDLHTDYEDGGGSVGE